MNLLSVFFYLILLLSPSSTPTETGLSQPREPGVFIENGVTAFSTEEVDLLRRIAIDMDADPTLRLTLRSTSEGLLTKQLKTMITDFGIQPTRIIVIEEKFANHPMSIVSLHLTNQDVSLQ
ncbi:MAG: hypothetical protein AAFQ02_13020 [Bacteroidota bacterium]